MGSRDHAEECPACGLERGGFNNVPCLCDQARSRELYQARLADGWRARALAAEAKVAAMEAVIHAAGEVVALANDGEPLADGILLLALALAGLHPVVIASSAGGE